MQIVVPLIGDVFRLDVDIAKAKLDQSKSVNGTWPEHMTNTTMNLQRKNLNKFKRIKILNKNPHSTQQGHELLNNKTFFSKKNTNSNIFDSCCC